MKVLILSHSSDLGGAEQSMLGLFDYLSQNTDIEPEFIIRRPLLKLAAELKKRGYKYHALYYTNWAQRNLAGDPNDVYWYAKQNTRAVEKIEKIITQVKPSLVITNTIVAPWAAIAAHNQTVPHVWFIREFGDDSGFKFRLGRDKTFENIGRLSTLVVANSKALAEFASANIDKAKITVLYPSLDLKKVQREIEQKVDNPFHDSNSLKLVITGRIASTKGQDIAAQAVGILTERGINAELCIIGNPSDEGDDRALLAVIKKYELEDKVHRIGYKQNPLAYVTKADVGIMASTSEAFGRATLEYMALGKPVVGTNAGGTPELVRHNINGYLFEPGSSNDLADILQKYTQNKDLITQHGHKSKQEALSIINGDCSPRHFYPKLQKAASAKYDKSKADENSSRQDWNIYPILVTADSKRPPISMHRLERGLVHFLKGVYVKFR